MTDEVLIRMGLDATAVGRGLRNVSSQVKEFGSEIKNSFKEAVHHLAAPLSVVGAVAGLEKVANAVKRIKGESEVLGTSTAFVQNVENLGTAAGIAGEKMDKMLHHFRDVLPVGADLEENFYKLADQLAAIQDPGTRAALVVQNFGAKGVEMLRILDGGAAGMKKLAAEFQSFSDVDIKSIEDANRHLEQVENRVTVITGKTAAWISLAARAVGSLTTKSFREMVAPGAVGREMARLNAGDQSEAERKEALRKQAQATAQQAKFIAESKQGLADYNRHLDDLKLKSGNAADKLAILNKRFEEEREAARKAGPTKDGYEAVMKMRDIEQEIADVKSAERKAQKEAAKEEQAAAEKQLRTREQITDATQEQLKAANSVVEAIHDRSAVTVGDLAEAGRRKIEAAEFYNAHSSGFRASAGLNQGESTAIAIDNLEKNARAARMSGNFSLADSLTSRALDLRKSIGGFLTTSESEPLRGVSDACKKTAEHLEELLRKANNEGLNINPKMG